MNNYEKELVLILSINFYLVYVGKNTLFIFKLHFLAVYFQNAPF